MNYNQILIELLYQMAVADQEFSDPEKQFISQVMAENGIDLASYNPAHTEIPKAEKDRMTILYYLLFLIKIDEHVDDTERKFAVKFGLKLGFREEMLNRMLDAMEQHLGNRLPDEELVKIIRQYLN